MPLSQFLYQVSCLTPWVYKFLLCVLLGVFWTYPLLFSVFLFFLRGLWPLHLLLRWASVFSRASWRHEAREAMDRLCAVAAKELSGVWSGLCSETLRFLFLSFFLLPFFLLFSSPVLLVCFSCPFRKRTSFAPPVAYVGTTHFARAKVPCAACALSKHHPFGYDSRHDAD